MAFILRPGNPLEKFWSPLLGTSKSILIYTGANPVYMPSDQLIERYKATHHLSDLDTAGHEFLIPISDDQKLGAGDLLEMKNEFATRWVMCQPMSASPLSSPISTTPSISARVRT